MFFLRNYLHYGCGVSRAVALCLFLAAAASRGGDYSLESAGVRAGIPANSSASEFNQAEAYLNVELPWGWDLGRDFWLQSRLDFSLGWLGDSGVDAVIGSAGPSLLLGYLDWPVTLEGGISPGFVSEDVFETKNLGIPFQFVNHVGVNWDVLRQVRLSYRFQHLSNAGLNDNNPGLNMHLFGIGYLF